MYSQHTNASKNLLNCGGRSLKEVKEEIVPSISGLSPLIRKLIICEEVSNKLN
jgi:hypothetical protein